MCTCSSACPAKSILLFEVEADVSCASVALGSTDADVALQPSLQDEFLLMFQAALGNNVHWLDWYCRSACSCTKNTLEPCLRNKLILF